MKLHLMALMILPAILFSSQDAAAVVGGSVELKNGSLRVDYADNDAKSKGLKDFVTLLQKEGALDDIVPNGGSTIELYELKNLPTGMRVGGVIYRNHKGEATIHKLKISVPLTDKVFATHGSPDDNFLSLTGQIGDVLWELCKKHGHSAPSAAIRYDFGDIVCNKEHASGVTNCMIWKL